ncbi:MAG: RNA polymerase sigma factor RpoD/SigA [Oscillospiraceae bacterium]|nr:RNA polymerase sigma factor RpoD/SigA [Oscillospiraceae bacterium]
MAEALLEKKTNGAGEEDISRFVQEIHGYPLLTAEQEREVAMGCARGDEDAIRTMVNSNLRLVVSIAREYAGRGVPLLDLIQEGSIGLLAAARNFDYTQECKFSTYATKWIRQGVNRCVLNHAGVIRVPLHTMEKMRKLLAVKSALEQESGEEATVEQLAEKTDISLEKVRQYLSLLPQVCSLDAPAGEDATLQQLLEDLQAPQPYEALVRRELKHTLEILLGLLTERQQEVLRLHFGMDDGVCLSLEEVGKALGISKERARQIKQTALEKLQKLGASFGLEDFLE